jgi:hypothetical protein
VQPVTQLVNIEILRSPGAPARLCSTFHKTKYRNGSEFFSKKTQNHFSFLFFSLSLQPFSGKHSGYFAKVAQLVEHNLAPKDIAVRLTLAR